MSMRSAKFNLGIFFVLLGVGIALDLTKGMIAGHRLVTASLLAIVFLGVLVIYLVRKRNYLPLGVPLASVSVLLFVAELTELTFVELWPIIPVGLAISALVYFVVEKQARPAIISLYVAVVFTGVQMGYVTGGWLYILPTLCILTGMLFLLPTWGKREDLPEIPMRSIVKRFEELKAEDEQAKE